MTNIYNLHDKAFFNVSAYVILKDGEKVATVAFKFPKDGAGRLWCYLHVIGLPMVRAYAGGYGYDKKSAAFTSAIDAQCKVKLENWQTGDYLAQYAIANAIEAQCAATDGKDWIDNVRDAGFTVLQAV